MYKEEDIMKFVYLVVEVSDPDKIILFGSYAYGEPNDKSDLDLLVIKNGQDFSVDDEVKLDLVLFRMRKEHRIGARYDIFFRTEKQVQESAISGGTFTDALQKGRVVYERAYQ